MKLPTIYENPSTHAQLLEKILKKHKNKEGNLLPILHMIQDNIGYIPEDLIEDIAAAINRSSAEIFGVISFYKHFRTKACGSIHIEFCQAEACQARGSKKITKEIQDFLTKHWPNATIEPVNCLGLCAQGPSALINQQPLALITIDTFKEKIEGINTCQN